MHTSFSLQFTRAGRPVRLRELTGQDERRVAGTSTEDALLLIDALLVEMPGAVAPPRAADLVAADRDKILAAVYERAFGDRITSTLNCTACGSPFDMSFSLREITAAVTPKPAPTGFEPVADDLFQAPGGWRFRLPTGRDECDAAVLDTARGEALLAERCIDPSGPRPEPQDLQAALEALAPLVELELKARCPECGRVRLLQFDIQTYLLRSIMVERSRLVAEVHRLASAYGWGFREILSLTRTERRRMVALIENETSRRARPSR